MPKASPIQTSFNAGELTPLLDGRTDVAKYQNGCYAVENMLLTVQGPAVKRPGTRFVKEIKSSANRTALVEFRFSRTSNYILEFGDLYIRFYTNQGAIIVASAAAYNGGTAYVVGNYVDYSGIIYYCIQAGTGQQPDISPLYWTAQTAYEIPTVYAQSDLFDSDNIFQLDWVQSADVVYFTHSSYPVQKLTRLTASTFSIAETLTTGGPFKVQNTSADTIYASAQTGAGITLTASANTFTADMVDGLVFLEEQSVVDVDPWQAQEFYKQNDRVKSDGKTFEAIVNGGTEYADKTITNITQADPAVVTTSAAHGYSNEDSVKLQGVVGMVEVNDLFFTIRVLTTTTFELKDIDSTGYTAYGSAGTSVKHIRSGSVRPVHSTGEQTDGASGVPWTYRDYGSGIAQITAFGSATSVTATVIDRIPSGAVGSGNASTRWALGKYSGEEGYPEKVVFFRERLCFAKGQEVDFSVVGDFENFRPTDFGEVTTESAFTMKLSSDRLNNVEWVSSGDSLLIGTTGAEFAIKEVTTAEVFGPTNAQISQQSQFGSRPIKPIKINDATLFVDASGLKLREFRFTFESEQYQSTEISILSSHITKSGIIDSAYDKNPDQILWFVRSDGTLAACTFNREQDVIAWSRHIIGGTGVVESVAVIPTPDGAADELWIIVNRTINGATKRYIEYLEQTFASDAALEDARFSDSGLTLKYTATAITGITKANPAVVTSTAHGLLNGQSVSIFGVTGMDGIAGVYVVANKTANTFELTGKDTIAFDAYVSGGSARRVVSTVSGLTHLEAESVSILADGATQPNVTVASGAITLQEPASAIQVGLGYNSILTTMRLDAGAADGTAQGKTKRVHNVTARLYRSVGLKFGPEGGPYDTLEFRDFQDSFDSSIPLFTGDKFMLWPASSEKPARLEFRSEWPLPFTVISVMPQLNTQDR